VSREEQSLAIGKGGQNVRLAAKLTGWKIDIVSDGEMLAEADQEGVLTKEGIITDETFTISLQEKMFQKSLTLLLKLTKDQKISTSLIRRLA
jgi:hypothetical protein